MDDQHSNSSEQPEKVDVTESEHIEMGESPESVDVDSRRTSDLIRIRRTLISRRRVLMERVEIPARKFPRRIKYLDMVRQIKRLTPRQEEAQYGEDVQGASRPNNPENANLDYLSEKRSLASRKEAQQFIEFVSEVNKTLIRASQFK